MREFFQDLLLGLSFVLCLIAIWLAPHWVQIFILAGVFMMIANLIGEE